MLGAIPLVGAAGAPLVGAARAELDDPAVDPNGARACYGRAGCLASRAAGAFPG